MDRQTLRLPRPTLWAAHKRTIDMHSNAYEIPVQVPADPTAVTRPHFLITNPLHAHRPTKAPVSSTSVHQLTSANLATFDESHTNRDRSGTTATDKLNSTLLDGTTTTEASSDEYRLTMESIIHLSSSPISAMQAHSAPMRHHNHNNNHNNNNNRHCAIDTNSVASSTHFTLVNGFGAMKQPKPIGNGRGYCCCKPIAAVIITMTILLAFIVFLMIFVIECELVVFHRNVFYRFLNSSKLIYDLISDPHMMLVEQ